MNSKKVELIQHSPLLHFQWEQDGLPRMSELRPKLNNFIKKQLSKVEPALFKHNEKLIENCFKENDTKNGYIAPYKLWITAEVNEPMLFHTQTSRDPNAVKGPYFADMKYVDATDYKRKHEKLTCRKGMIYQNISIEIKSWNEDLISLIEKALDIMLLFENFGARQSKGFGSFTVKDSAYVKNPKTWINNNDCIEACYCFSFKENKNWVYILKTIEEGWKKIRGGVREDNKKMFETSKLYLYLLNNLPNFETASASKLSYLRMLLGFASDGEYKKSDKTPVYALHKTKEAKRLSSPVRFKIIENKLYLFLMKIESFSFETNTPVTLPLTKSDEFNYIDFFKQSDTLKVFYNKYSPIK